MALEYTVITLLQQLNVTNEVHTAEISSHATVLLLTLQVWLK